MDRHKSLYKDNFSLFSPKNARLNERTEIRAKDRRDRFYSRRNILLTPANQVFVENKENELNTEGAKSGDNQSKIDEKIQNGNSRLGRVVSKSQGPALNRQEQFLQRFIDWRQSKRKQDLFKNTKEIQKKPFVPVANANKLDIASEKRTNLTSSNTFAPKDHNFKAPEGLKAPVSAAKAAQINAKQRQSLYTVAPNPQKKKPEPEAVVKKFPIARKAPPSNRLPRPGTALCTTPMTKTQSNNPVSNGVKKNVGVVQSTSKPFTMPTKTLKKSSITADAVPTSCTKSGTRNLAKPRPLKLPPPPPASNHQPSVAGKALKSRAATITRVVKPIRGGGMTNGAVGKAKPAAINKRQDPIPKSKPNLAVSMKAKRINPVSSRPIAVAKKQPGKIKKDKQQLLEVACQQICSAAAETPRDQFSPTNAFGTFVTSTQRKSHSSSQSTLEFLTLDSNAVESISPVEPAETALSNRASAVKRQQTELKLGEEVPRGRSRSLSKSKKNKFNFVRYDDSPAKFEEKEVIPEAKEELDIINEPQNINLDENAKIDTKQGPEERPLNYLSPYVSVTRGKVNSKTEKEKRNSIYMQADTDVMESEKNKEIDSVTLRRTIETVRYFRKQLADEIQRLHGICEKWENYKSENLSRLQETGGDDMINVAIGQTKLLTSKKFKQFSGLIDRCEKGATAPLPMVNDGSEDTKPITAEDLEGFWSMVGLQTDNIDKRFANLERWCANDWIDPDFAEQQAAKIRKPKTTSVHKTASNGKAKPNSGLQQWMRKMQSDLRKKKAMAATEENVEDVGNDVILIPSQKRPSVGTPQRNKTETRRVSIIVKDRKLHSAAPTILTINTPKRRSSTQTSRLDSPQLLGSPKLLKHVKEFKRSLTNLQKSGDERCDLWADLRRSANVRTPSPAFENTPSMKSNVRKSILKTPGTAKGKPKNVNFNEKLKIKKYKFTIDSDESDTDDKENHRDENILTGVGDDDEKRTYGLRTRTVVLRPSAEFQIPE